MMNAKSRCHIFLFGALLAAFLLVSITSCAVQGVFNHEEGPESSQEAGLQQDNFPEEKEEIYLFDYTDVKVSGTSTLDAEIKNCNIYQDLYGDLMVLGEIINNSAVTKTNIEITFSILDAGQNTFEFIKLPALAEYLRGGFIVPFDFIYENRAGYIDISEIKIGLNYRNYNKELKGYPVVSDEGFFYDKDIITIKGNIFNLGSNEVEDLKILCTFYNKKNQVVFIRECFLENDRLKIREKQDFEVRVLLDSYIKEFTSYKIEVFFRDSVIA